MLLSVNAAPPPPRVDVNFYRDILAVISEGFVEPFNEEEFIYNSLNGGLQGIDPHSSYISPADYAKFKEGVSGEFSGIGIQIISENGFIKVISPLDDTPAFKAGIKAGDYITHIDGENIYQISIEEASARMRGKSGTPLKLVLLRFGEEKPLEISLTREKIKSKSVTVKLEEEVAIIRISSFMATTALEIKEALAQIKTEIKGVILDIRNNPGGLMDQAILISNFFLKEGEKIVSVKGKPGNRLEKPPEKPLSAFPLCIKEKECLDLKITYESGEITFFADDTAIIPSKLPVIVIINKASASASEILAGALKDNKRAIIVGEVSFGKGVVQTILPVYNGEKGAIKLTTSRYYSPSGASIQTAGITPHILIADAKIESSETRFQALFSQREGDLKNHMPPEKLEEIAKQSEKYNKKKDIMKTYSSDFQMLNALTILESLIIASPGS